MYAVGDDLREHTVIVDRRRQRTGVAVVQGDDAVEGMRNLMQPGVNRFARFLANSRRCVR
ncbi:MAG: hypothetical protein U0694_12150 [Anaerolineae bacterium]